MKYILIRYHSERMFLTLDLQLMVTEALQMAPRVVLEPMTSDEIPTSEAPLNFPWKSVSATKGVTNRFFAYSPEGERLLEFEHRVVSYGQK